MFFVLFVVKKFKRMKLFLLSLLIVIGLLSKSQPTDRVLSIYVDENGTVWCGTDTGMLKKVGDTWTSFNTIEGNNETIVLGQVNSLAPQFTAYGSEFWAATTYGATVASYDVDGISGATNYTIASSDIASDSINHVMLDENNFRYFSTDSGISVFAGDTFMIINDLEDMGNNNYFNASVASNDTIYIASNKGVGRAVYNGVDGYTGASTWQLPYQYGLPSDSITSIFISDDNSQWYGTDAGIAKHIGDKGKDDWVLTLKSADLENTYINVIAEDSAHNIWLGTNGGLVKLDSDIDDKNYNQRITTFTTEDGLPSNVINAIYVADSLNMWIGTDLGPYLISKPAVSIDDLRTITQIPFSIYPNPIIDKLMIDFKTISTQYIEVKVYSLSGKLVGIPYRGIVNSDSRVTIPMESSEGYTSGIYILRIELEGFNKTMKIIKK